MKKVLEWIGLFDSNISAAERVFRMVWFFILIGGGTTTGLLAKSTLMFRAAGPVAWIGIGLAASLMMAFTILLLKLASKQAAEADYTRAVAQQPHHTNP